MTQSRFPIFELFNPTFAQLCTVLDLLTLNIRNSFGKNDYENTYK